MNLCKLLFILIFLCLCLTARALHAQTPIILTDEQSQYPVGTHLEILEDRDGALSFAEVRSEAYDHLFIPSTEETPNLGISNSAFWVRFRVRNETSTMDEWFIELANPNISEVSFYIPQANSSAYQVITTGRAYPIDSRPIAHRNFVALLRLPPRAEAEIYIRAESLPLSLPLTIWSPQGFLQAVQQDYLALGFIVGILLIMSGYNLFLYFSLRDKSYLYYVLFISCLLGLRIVREGLIVEFFNSNATIFHVRAELLIFSLLFVFLLGFTKYFLLTQAYSLRLDRTIYYLRISVILLSVLLILFPRSLLFIVFYLITMLICAGVVMASGIVVWQKGYKAARFFLFTWVGFMLQIGIRIGTEGGILPHEWFANRIDIASVWIVLMLSFALADRIKLLTWEKEEAQAELLKQQQEMLRLSDEYTNALQTTNEQLQQTVREKEKAQQALQAYAKELERSNNELQNFAYVASHDLQEPLRKIQAFGDRLQTKNADQLSEQGQDYINRMQSAAARMQTLIQDLLIFSRITTTSEPFVLVNLTAVVQRVIQQLEGQTEALSAKITVATLPQIEAERSQMHHLFLNLISNSLKFHRNGVPPEIVITSEVVPEENSCRILVTDNGIGFREEYKERIFIIFQRLHSRDQYPGTGIGLAVCKKIVERHGGTLTALSKVEQGATFIITLPLSQN